MHWTTSIPREGSRRSELRFLLVPRSVDRGGYRDWEIATKAEALLEE